MHCYKVGGAVRDALLGRQPQDIDYVVVGATPAEMHAKGFLPVGSDFPVFLHPETKQEYALARTERKSGTRHQDFVFHASPDVTLAEDLSRRDFTINAMAEDDAGNIIDPYAGRYHLAKRELHHVSEAFREDPLRVLRAARYASTLGFTIAPATNNLLQEMVAAGELAHLSPERIWQELAQGLNATNPVHYLNLLRHLGVLKVILPEVDALFGVPQSHQHHPEGCAGTHTLLVLGVAALNFWPLAVRLACLLHDLGKTATPKDKLPAHPGHEVVSGKLAKAVCTRLRVPNKITQQVVVAANEHGNVHKFTQLDAAAKIALFSRVGVWQDDRNLNCLLAVAACDNAAHPQRSNYNMHPNHNLIWQAVTAARQADVATAAKQAPSDPATAVQACRVASLAALPD